MYLRKKIKKWKRSAGIKQSAVSFILIFTAFSCFSQDQSEWLELGDAAFKNEDYQKAILFYFRVISKEVTTDISRPYEMTPYIRTTPKKEETVPAAKNQKTKPAPKLNQPAQMLQYVTHQLAESYRLNHDYTNAEIWYKKSVSGKPPLPYPYDRYWYGDALIKNKNYKAALPEFESIIKLGERKNPALFNQAKAKLLGSKLINDSTYYKKEITLSPLDSVFNGGSTSFSANYYGDAHVIQFTNSAYDRSSEDAKKQNSQDCDIYTVNKTETGWDNAIKMESTINTDEHEASGCLSEDKSTYYFTRWSVTKNECAIYVSKMRNQQWLVAEKLSENVNLPGFKSMHPCLSKDGTKLYFSSNRPGGSGKMDLWYVKLNDKEKTEGSPVNMGAKFNTTEDEVTPFIHFQTNTLFFSSNGLPGFGGLDVFKSTYDPDSLWSIPKNTGSPINSSKDDAYFVLERNQLNGFLSSDREECKSCSGGACYKIYSVSKKANVFQMRGSVYNAETNSPMPGVLLTFKDMHGEDDPFYMVTDSLGFFSAPIKEGRDLYIKAQKNGYFGDANTLSTLELTESQDFSENFFLSPIPKGDIIIPGIEYEKEKASLKPESIDVLNGFVDFLNLNNNLKVEISSHTDERGNDDYNLKLSLDRAKVVVNYLISKGIASDRLIAIGYGETQPLIPHATTEEEHQKNRRTVLRLVSESEIKTPK